MNNGRPTQIAGIDKINNGQFTIIDTDKYIDDLKQLYSESGTPLHPDTERLIRNHINEINGNPIDTQAGPPGTHVEIQVLNDLYTQAGGAPNISEATIATVYPDGGPFIACSNCTGIIGNAPNVDVITGTR